MKPNNRILSYLCCACPPAADPYFTAASAHIGLPGWFQFRIQTLVIELAPRRDASPRFTLHTGGGHGCLYKNFSARNRCSEARTCTRTNGVDETKRWSRRCLGAILRGTPDARRNLYWCVGTRVCVTACTSTRFHRDFDYLI